MTGMMGVTFPIYLQQCYQMCCVMMLFFFFQAEDGIRDYKVTGVQTCALPILSDAYEIASADTIRLYRPGSAQPFHRRCRSRHRTKLRRPHRSPTLQPPRAEIGRASCRERV